MSIIYYKSAIKIVVRFLTISISSREYFVNSCFLVYNFTQHVDYELNTCFASKLLNKPTYIIWLKE